LSSGYIMFFFDGPVFTGPFFLAQNIKIYK